MMSRIRRLFSFSVVFVFLTAFTCDNEPLEGEFFIDDGTDNDCEEVQNISANAAFAFSNANEDNYETLCQAYKNALLNEIAICGDDATLQALVEDLGDCTNEPAGFNCNGLELVNVFGGPENCDYNAYENFGISQVYIAEINTTDEDGDGIDDHSFTKLLLTDALINIGANNSFESFQTTPNYIFEIALFSLGTNGLNPGNYQPMIFVNSETEPYLSVSVSRFTTDNCVTDALICDSTTSTLNGIVSVNGSPGNYDLCFDFLLDLDDNCFKGTYSGDFIPLDF